MCRFVGSSIAAPCADILTTRQRKLEPSPERAIWTYGLGLPAHRKGKCWKDEGAIEEKVAGS